MLHILGKFLCNKTSIVILEFTYNKNLLHMTQYKDIILHSTVGYQSRIKRNLGINNNIYVFISISLIHAKYFFWFGKNSPKLAHYRKGIINTFKKIIKFQTKCLKNYTFSVIFNKFIKQCYLMTVNVSNVSMKKCQFDENNLTESIFLIELFDMIQREKSTNENNCIPGFLKDGI